MRDCIIANTVFDWGVPAGDAVLRMYAQGWFPMFDDESGVTQWVQPRRRGIIPLDERFRPARSLRARRRCAPRAGGAGIRATAPGR